MLRHARNFLFRNGNVGNNIRFSTTEAASPTPAAAATPPVDKGTKIQQWKKFWTVLYSDYKEVAQDTLTEIKTRPRKAAVYFSAIGGVLYAMAENPEARTYYAALLEASDDMIQVSDLNKNPASEERLKLIFSAYNEGTIRYMNLGLFSLIWLGNYHENCALYPSQCSYLKPGFLGFHQRILDVGLLGKWWNISRYMKDYDISPIEFPNK